LSTSGNLIPTQWVSHPAVWIRTPIGLAMGELGTFSGETTPPSTTRIDFKTSSWIGNYLEGASHSGGDETKIV